LAGIIALVRERWLSGRAVSLHIALILFVPGCALAAWWQITRAFDGNGLSYLYSVEWPVFAFLAVYFWWMLLHTDYDTVGLKGMRQQMAAAHPAPEVSQPVAAPVRVAEDDPELAAYNARLAALSASGPKTWRNPEAPVVRRSR
jgi:DNA-binding transcriptional regulator of glucitol operon